MDLTERETRRAQLRDPLTYATVGEWFADYHGFVPIQMAHGLSQVIAARNISFPEAYTLLRDRGAIIEIHPDPVGALDPEQDARSGSSVPANFAHSPRSTMVNWDTVDTSDLVYAIPEGSGIVVIPRAKAVELAAIVDAVEGSATWGELRARLPEGEWERIAGMNDFEDGAPADEDPFEADELFGWADGDYPDWPSQQALKWVPKDIAERYGEVMDSSLNGEFLHIPEGNEAGLVAAFREHGARIEKDPAVVLRATRFI